MAKKNSKKWFFSVSSVVFSVSCFFMLYLIDFGIEKQLFITFSGCIYYLALLGEYRLGRYEKDQTAKGMIAASLMATMFFFFSSSYGVYLNFVISLWVLMFFFLVVTFLITLQYMAIVGHGNRWYLKLIYSFLLGFSMMEFGWVINFWPFGYLTTGVISLIFYYILWDFVQDYFLRRLSKKKVVVNSIFFVSLIVLILTTSKWMPNI
ncbi:hypothetical protein ACFL16_00915 [Patescibacteria group bacterium]